MKADLHIHSVNSDGLDAIDSLLQQYSDDRFKYSHVAITDHYTIAPELRNDEVLELKKRKYNIDIIPGMEYVAEINGEHVHLLCYFNRFSDVTKPILGYLETQKDFTRQFNRLAKERLWEENINVPDIEYERINDTSYMPLIQEVVKLTDMTAKECRKKFFEYMAEFNIQVGKKLNAAEIIEEVHKSKGLIVMAHPLQFKNETMMEAIRLGVDGLECIYAAYSQDKRDYLIDIAEKNNILITAGSDYHSKTDYVKHGQIGDVALEGEHLKKFLHKLKVV